MKLKKSSWWWRYYVFLCEDLDNGKYPAEAAKHGISLCRLVNGIFWRTLFFLIFRIVPAAFIVFSAFFSIYWLFAHGFTVPANRPWSIFFIAGLTTWGLLAMIAIIVGAVALWDSMPYYKSSSEESSDSGVIRSWLRAKKQKVCPMIEIVDDEK